MGTIITKYRTTTATLHLLQNVEGEMYSLIIPDNKTVAISSSLDSSSESEITLILEGRRYQFTFEACGIRASFGMRTWLIAQYLA